MLTSVSNSSSHDSVKYGTYYTAEEITDIFAPAKDTVDAVTEWLSSEGFDRVSLSVNKQWLQLDAPVASVEKLFNTRYHVYKHDSTGKVNVACDEYAFVSFTIATLADNSTRYHLPTHLKEHIDYITPGIKLLAAGNGPPVKRSLLGKRSSGISSMKRKKNIGKLPPITHPLPMALEALLAMNATSVCNAAITPDCIFRMFSNPVAEKIRC